MDRERGEAGPGDIVTQRPVGLGAWIGPIAYGLNSSGKPGASKNRTSSSRGLGPAHGTDRLIKEWYGPVCRQLGAGRDCAALSTLLAQLRDEYTGPDGAVSREILQLLLSTLLLEIDRLPGDSENGDPHAGSEIYALLRTELERSYATTRRAEDYAGRLGCTVKTLTRACLAATGQSVKQVIDARVALEAQRLLAHTDEPVAVIGRRLGFCEPTNFGKFFTRHTGTTPGDFRRTHHGPQ